MGSRGDEPSVGVVGPSEGRMGLAKSATVVDATGILVPDARSTRFPWSMRTLVPPRPAVWNGPHLPTPSPKPCNN
jgi:hypothetical protein